MQILMLTPALPWPPMSGAAIRNYGILRGLAGAGHSVTLFSFAEPGQDPAAGPLAQHCSHIETFTPPARSRTDRLRSLLFSTRADIEGRLWSEQLAKRLQQILQEKSFDVIQLEGIEFAAYLPVVQEAGLAAHLVFDAHNAEAELQRAIYRIDRGHLARWPQALYSYIQSRRIARVERLLCHTARCVVAVSDEDAALLRTCRDDGRVYVMPNGIDTDLYNTPAEQIDLGPHALVFTGKMDYRPNVDAVMWFAQAVLPRIQAAVPEATFTVVGQKPHPALLPLHGQQGISITGRVDSILPYLHAAAVYVAPLRMGSGTRLKILEAAAAGQCVVATGLAASGLRAELRSAMIIREDTETLATAIVQLLQNPQQRRELGSRARDLVRQYYDWSVLVPHLLEAYRETGLG